MKFISRSELTQLAQNMKDFATKTELAFLHNRLDGAVRRHDFEILKVAVDELKDFTPKLAKTLDVNTRIDKIHRDLEYELK